MEGGRGDGSEQRGGISVEPLILIKLKKTVLNSSTNVFYCTVWILGWTTVPTQVSPSLL